MYPYDEIVGTNSRSARCYRDVVLSRNGRCDRRCGGGGAVGRLDETWEEMSSTGEAPTKLAGALANDMAANDMAAKDMAAKDTATAARIDTDRC